MRGRTAVFAGNLIRVDMYLVNLLDQIRNSELRIWIWILTVFIRDSEKFQKKVQYFKKN